jgi:hypothetical protein
MVIWGSRTREAEIEEGDFYCPSCRTWRRYEKKRVSKYFTLYFIRLLKTSDIGEYVECQVCHTTYTPDVVGLLRWHIVNIEWEPQPERRLAKTEDAHVAAGVTTEDTYTYSSERSVMVSSAATSSYMSETQLGGTIGKDNLGSLTRMIKESFKNEIAQEESVTDKESYTISKKVILDGNKATHYRLAWVDVWYKGVAEIEVEGMEGLHSFPFEYRDHTALDIQQVKREDGQ